MRIKEFFGILIFLLLVLGGGLLFLSSRLNMIYFYIREGLVLFILCYLPFFYRKIMKSLNSIGGGMGLLRERDLSSRLSPVGQYEANRIMNVFNRMMEQLKNGRLCLREQSNFLDLLIETSPMGVVLTTLDEDLSGLNPMAQKVLGVRQENVLGKKMSEIDSPLAAELTDVPKGETATVRLNNSNTYRCTHSSFIDREFQHPFSLIESLTDEVVEAEKKAYERAIRMIVREANNTTTEITPTLDMVEQTLSTEEGMDDICDVIRVCTEHCFSTGRFVTRFADVVKIPEPTLAPADLNNLAFTCRRLMEGMCTDRNIKLRLEIDKTLREVEMDAFLFEQVLVNIIKNAVRSIGRGGKIIVRTLSPAIIEMADNDKEISKKVEARLFSPFFSTRPNSQEIGLTFIREVLMRHGYTFSLWTYADELTRFRIFFP